jgi:hypothetical protein
MAGRLTNREHFTDEEITRIVAAVDGVSERTAANIVKKYRNICQTTERCLALDSAFEPLPCSGVSRALGPGKSGKMAKRARPWGRRTDRKPGMSNQLVMRRAVTPAAAQAAPSP